MPTRPTRTRLEPKARLPRTVLSAQPDQTAMLAERDVPSIAAPAWNAQPTNTGEYRFRGGGVCVRTEPGAFVARWPQPRCESIRVQCVREPIDGTRPLGWQHA